MNHAPFEQFLAACGSDEPLRIGVGLKDEMQSVNRMLSQPFVVIGRRPDSDLVLDHWQVSRRHAYLQLIEGRYYCVDVGSRTGTHGGDVIERSGWLEEGRMIQIGPFAVRPEWPSRPARESRPLPGVTWDLPATRTIGPTSWKMDRSLVLVGRSPACRIRMAEPDVSKFHCSLVLTWMGVWVVDLLGQKGVYVNGELVRCARLGDNDELRVGRHVLRPHYDQALPPLETSAGLSSTLEGPTRQLPARRSKSSPPSSIPTGPNWPNLGQDSPTLLERPEGNLDPTVSVLVQQFGLIQQQMFDQFHQTMMMMFEGFAALHRETSGSLREEFEEVRKLSQEIESLRVETAKLAESTSKAAERPRPTTNGHGSADPRPNPSKPVYEPIAKPTSPEPEPGGDIHAQLCLRLATIQTERQNRWQKILGMMSSRS